MRNWEFVISNLKNGSDVTVDPAHWNLGNPEYVKILELWKNANFNLESIKWTNYYPEKDFPENVRKLRGFIWRGDERIMSKEDIFPKEEIELDEKIKKKSKLENAKENTPMKVRKETKNYDKLNLVKK
jgi:hypothetical protein